MAECQMELVREKMVMDYFSIVLQLRPDFNEDEMGAQAKKSHFKKSLDFITSVGAF